MIKQGFRLQVLVYRKSSFLKLLFFGLLFLAIPYTLYPIPYSHAQEISLSVKKNVVKNFKADLKNLLPFGTSENCELKPQGDANCDGSVNQFDLSIWEIEFNSENSPKRSDFNNDGLINLLDFGIWRNTYFPQKAVSLSGSCSETQPTQTAWGSIASLLHCSIVKSKIALSSLSTLPSSLFSVSAQETPPKIQPLNSSQAIVSGSGNGFVLNSGQNGQTQQISFNPEANAVSSQLFDSNGNLLANISFLASGTTVVTTEDNGVSVQINKTAEGAVIEFFRNPDGSLIAIKSWPNLGSYERREPPLSVTIPGTGSTRNVLNIQPNGDGIFESTNNLGGVISRTQLRSNGTYVSEDLQHKTMVQSNSQVGFTTLTMPNNLGGKTDYMFFKGELYALIQTDNKDFYYIAKPLNSEGTSWNFESNINGQKTERIISDPIKELSANTPDPKELIKYINFYKSARADPEALNFADGFTNTPRQIQSQVNKANEILAISQTRAPDVLGIVYAQEPTVKPATSKDLTEHREDATREDGGRSGVFSDKAFTEQTGSQRTSGQNSLSYEIGAVVGGQVTITTTYNGQTFTTQVPSADLASCNCLNPGGYFTSADAARDFFAGHGAPSEALPPAPTTAAPPPPPAVAPVIQPAPALVDQERDRWAIAAAPVAAAPPATVGQTWQMGNAVASVTKVEDGVITATLAGAGLNGPTTFTQNPGTLTTTFQDDRGVFTANAGVLNSMSSDVSASGSYIGRSAFDGSLVAVGYRDADENGKNDFVDANGKIVDDGTGGARPATEAEVAAWEGQQKEQADVTGAPQPDVFTGTQDPWSDAAKATGAYNWDDVGFDARPDDTGPANPAGLPQDGPVNADAPASEEQSIDASTSVDSGESQNF